MSKTEDNSFEKKIFSLKITSKFTYILLIFSLLFTLLFTVFLNYQSYTYNKGYNLLFFCICLVILGFIYSLFHTVFNTTFAIQLSNKNLIIKKPFNKSITLRYDQISEINIFYDKLPIPLRRTPYDDILIKRKFNKPIKIMIQKYKIDFRNDSNFMNWTNFLVSKTSVKIHIYTIYKKGFAKGKIKTSAKLEWSDNPNVYKQMKQ